MYQAVLLIGGAKPKQIRTGVWETMEKAVSELGALTYGKIPTRTTWTAVINTK